MLKIDVVQLLKEYKNSRDFLDKISLFIGATREDQAVVLLEQFLRQAHIKSMSDYEPLDYRAFEQFLESRGVDEAALFTAEYVASLGSLRIFISWINDTKINWKAVEAALPQLSQICTFLAEKSLFDLSEIAPWFHHVSKGWLNTANFLEIAESLRILNDLNILNKPMLLKMKEQGLSAWASVIILLQSKGLGSLITESNDAWAELKVVKDLENMGLLNESNVRVIFEGHRTWQDPFRVQKRVEILATYYHNHIKDFTIRRPDGAMLSATQAVLDIVVNEMPGHDYIISAISTLKCRELLSAENLQALIVSPYFKDTARVLSRLADLELLNPSAYVTNILKHQQYMSALNRKLDDFVKAGEIYDAATPKDRIVSYSATVSIRHMLENLSSAFEGEVLTQADEARSAALFSVPAVARSATLFSVPAAAGGASAAAGAASASPM